MKPEHITHDYIRKFFDLSTSQQDKKILDFIMSHLKLKEFAHNHYICRAGDNSSAMYFIEAGEINVRGRNNEILNELPPGAYFGEYAALTGGKRTADIQAKGTVLVYQLDRNILLALTRNSSKIFSLFLKNAYDQSADRYQKLIRALNARRGLNAARGKRSSFFSLFLNYYIVIVIFCVLMLVSISPIADAMHPLWLASPIIFLVVYIALTKRALEAIVLSVIYITIMLANVNFIASLYGHILSAITETADILLLVALMGSMTRLFSASGSINALKYTAEQKIKTRQGTLFAAFCSMILIAIDEYLSVLINGACFTPLSDRRRIPREKSSMVMGMTPGAICIISPISLTGIYIAGVIAMSGGTRELFISAIPFNFASLITLGVVLLLIFEKAPLFKYLKKSISRVQNGGSLWPEGTDNGGNSENANRGQISNLLLPIVVFAGSSIIAGTLEAGSFSINVLYGMFITLIFMFFLYCFQQYMTPEQFFRNIVFGIESMLAPVVMFVVSKCFATGVEEIGFSIWLNDVVQNLIGGQVWMLPAIIFGACTVIGALFDNPWAMYAIGIPIALKLANSIGHSPGMYIGAVCAAGLAGNELALGDIFFIGPMLGINPIAYYRAKLPYVIMISLLALAAYAAAGYYAVK